MSYVKLFKVVQDTAVGIQSVNQAIDNNAALLSLLDSKHSVDFAATASMFRRPGRHDDPLIARSVVRCTVDTSRAVPVLVPIVSGPIFGSFVFTRLAAGQWRIALATPQLWFAVALCESTASIDRKATVYRSYASSVGPVCIVSTWEKSTSWALADLDFSLVVWCESTPA